MNRAPSYPWYPGDAESSADIRLMNLEEYGAYRKLLDFCWLSARQCYLRDDPDQLAQLLGIDRTKFDSIWKTISCKFRARNGTIFNARQVQIRREQRRRYLQTVKNGRLGGRPKITRAVSGKKPEGFQNQNLNETQEKPLSSSSSISSSSVPSEQEEQRNIPSECSASRRSADAEPLDAGATVASLPVVGSPNGSGDYRVSETQVVRWSSLYPGTDVHRELLAMIGWLEANPERRKTRRGICRFINGWLSRAQNRGSPAPKTKSRYEELFGHPDEHPETPGGLLKL